MTTFPRAPGLPELMDQAWWPVSFRNAHTAYIRWLMRREGILSALLERLDRLVDRPEGVRVVDLCSGSGGPWPDLVANVAERDERPVHVTATDRFPSDADPVSAGESGVVFDREPQEAVQAVSTREADVFTIVNGFHHLSDDEQRALLRTVRERRIPLLIGEIVDPSVRTTVSVLPAPIAFAVFALLHARQLGAANVFFSVVVPVLPFVALWDGFASCLRAQTPDQLRRLLEQEVPDGVVQTGSMSPGAVPFVWATLTFPRLPEVPPCTT